MKRGVAKVKKEEDIIRESSLRIMASLSTKKNKGLWECVWGKWDRA